MARQTFTWLPEFESQMSQAPSVNITKFGDGYEARVATGINNNPQKWSLQFTMNDANSASALAFVRARNAVESFYWMNPMGETIIVVCRTWKTSRKQGHYVTSLEFEQVFEA